MEELKINGKAIYSTKGAAREYGCGGCGFFYEEECECTLTPGEYNKVGYCGSVLRRDDKNVIYKYIGEVNDKT